MRQLREYAAKARGFAANMGTSLPGQGVLLSATMWGDLGRIAGVLAEIEFGARGPELEFRDSPPEVRRAVELRCLGDGI